MANNALKPVAGVARPVCDLSEIEIGDAFRLILRVSTALDRSGQAARGTEFWDAAMRLRSYGQVIDLAREYVEVTS